MVTNHQRINSEEIENTYISHSLSTGNQSFFYLVTNRQRKKLQCEENVWENDLFEDRLPRFARNDIYIY